MQSLAFGGLYWCAKEFVFLVRIKVVLVRDRKLDWCAKENGVAIAIAA